MKKYRVIYLLNYAPNYRNVFLEELGKLVDLTVVSFSGASANLKDPDERRGYTYIELKQKRILGISLQLKEFTKLCGDYDVLIIGFDLHRPFRLLSLLRKRRVILAGLIYGKNNNFIVRTTRKFLIGLSEGVLVYSKLVKEKLEKEVPKPIISFNNTSFSKSDIEILPFKFEKDKLNLLWVGRYQKRKKIERLVDLAKNNEKICLRLIGPGIKENIHIEETDDNIQIFPEAYGSELREHFEWAHAVFNPGGAGLLVMNAARFGRPIFIDHYSHHGPEIQLAKDASQIFIDFGNWNEVKNLVQQCINDREFLVQKGNELARVMEMSYTVEFMAQQYYRAIIGDWDS